MGDCEAREARMGSELSQAKDSREGWLGVVKLARLVEVREVRFPDLTLRLDDDGWLCAVAEDNDVALAAPSEDYPSRTARFMRWLDLPGLAAWLRWFGRGQQ
jgi:hypothetical protein